MSRALELAARGRGSTHPNPRVGCVVVSDGVCVGDGWHAVAGEPHAEIHALRAAGERVRGADLFVSLEPCSHFGRTPPCVDALVQAGVRKVWAAMQDPDPRVAGQGLARLREAGIETQCGLMEAEAAVLNRGFVSRLRRGRPFVTLKLAASLDGRTAMASGESRWITGPQARADVHRLRAEAGAVLTTAATLIADDPMLSVRDWQADRLRQPDRIVLDSRGRAPLNAQVWAQGARRFWIVGADLSPPPPAGVERIGIARDAQGHVQLPALLAELGRREINELLVECGPHFAGALLAQGLADEVVLYLAPSLLGHEARPLAFLPLLMKLEQRIGFDIAEAVKVGADLRIMLVPRERS